MSLSQDPVFPRLQNEFACATRDITGQPWSGFSGVHDVEAGAVHTTNGAGPHNIQMFVLAKDGTVLTCLPGYWHPDDLSRELDLAKELNKVWTDRKLSRAQKDARFTELHTQHIAEHPHAMVKRSQMQGFDKKFEQKRLAETDTVYAMTGGKDDGPIFKTTDVILHERIAKQPFRKYQEFDFVAFSDYGRAKYDKKEEGGGPVVDLRPQTVEKKRLAEQKRKEAMVRRHQNIVKRMRMEEQRKATMRTRLVKRLRAGGLRIR